MCPQLSKKQIICVVTYWEGWVKIFAENVEMIFGGATKHASGNFLSKNYDFYSDYESTIKDKTKNVLVEGTHNLALPTSKQ